MNSIAYITLEEAIAKHDEIILASGGLLGLRDEGLLISALTLIQNDLYYPTFSSKLVHLIFSINKNHCFIDGNKRASVSLAGSFLLKNGLPFEFVSDFIIMMEEIVVWLANDEITKNTLALIIMFLFCKFESDKDDHCLWIKKLVITQREIEKKYLNIIQMANIMISELKKTNRINEIQIHEDRITNAEKEIRSAQTQIKIWELILKFLQN